jgi:acetyl-CoA C-acetyltransferase
MTDLLDRIAIVGMGLTKFGERWDQSADDLIVDAVYEALADAGIELGDIQAAWVGTAASGHSGGCLARPLKLQHIPVTRVENACASGTDAFRNAAYAVAAGAYDIALVVGFEKLKDSGITGLGGIRVHPLFYRGMTTPGMFGLVANRYFHRRGWSEERGRELLAKISVKSHHNGMNSPKAHFRKEITVEDVLRAPIISSPLGLYDCCPVSDGAAAAIIMRKDLAKGLRDDPVYVRAMAVGTGAGESPLQAGYEFGSFAENVSTAKMAYAQAGISDPRRELDLAIVHDCFSISEMIIYEDLGFSAPGQAGEDIEAGTFSMAGELPVNSDGGLKCFGHPIGASGLRMIYECYKQLQGKAGARQIKNAELALTHNLGGSVIGSWTCAIGVFSNY